jgi:hypothetical protein
LNDFGDGEVALPVKGDQHIRGNVLEIHRSVMTRGTLKSLTVRPASELPVLGSTRSSRTACLRLV